MTNQTIDGVPRDYVLRLTPEAHSVMLGMVEHCLNVRACMGVDEGFKDFDTEEEHYFVKELRALLEAKPAEVTGDDVLRWMDEHAAAQPQGEPVAYLDLKKIQPAGMAYATKMRVNHRQTALYAEQPATVAVAQMCDCNQGRLTCNGRCKP